MPAIWNAASSGSSARAAGDCAIRLWPKPARASGDNAPLALVELVDRPDVEAVELADDAEA